MKQLGIVFDLDGTIVDSPGKFLELVAYALEPFGVIPTCELIEGQRHLPPHHFFDGILEKGQAKVAYQRMAELSDKIIKTYKLFPGIKALLKDLYQSETKLALWTGRDLDSCMKVLKAHEIQHYFEIIVSGSCVSRNKPNTEGFEKAAKHLQIPYENLAMVGDHHHDISAAHEVGATAVWAKWLPEERLLPKVREPDHEFTCVSSFRSWVEPRYFS